jgi:molybdate transport system ATP-binding protein
MEIRYQLKQPIVLDVHFEAQGFTVMMGRSGQGKTSLLRAIAGLLPAEGTPYGGLAPYERPIGYVPQDLCLFPHLSVWRNVAFGVASPEKRDIAMRLLDLFGLEGLADRKPAQLSGGQQQRVALARALAPNPELLLLDEPTSALDPVTRDEVLAELRGVCGKTGPTILAVTHDRQTALAADRLVVLDHGCIVQQGPPHELARNPRDENVARLLGCSIAAPYAGRGIGIVG